MRSQRVWIAFVAVLLIGGTTALWLFGRIQSQAWHRHLCTALSNSGNAATVKTLLANGANPNLPCLVEDEPTFFERLREQLSRTRQQDGTKVSPIVMAMVIDDEASVGALLDAGANPNAKDSDGETILYWACWGHRPDIVQVLLKHEADPRARDANGMTPREEVEKDLSTLKHLRTRDRGVSSNRTVAAIQKRIGAEDRKRAEARDQEILALLRAAEQRSPETEKAKN